MKKVLLVLSIVLVLTFAFAGVAYATDAPAPAATDSVSKVITDGFNEVKVQTEEIVFDVVIWICVAITVIWLIVSIVKALVSYRQGNGFNAFQIVLAVAVLILLLTVPEALWALVG